VGEFPDPGIHAFALLHGDFASILYYSASLAFCFSGSSLYTEM